MKRNLGIGWLLALALTTGVLAAACGSALGSAVEPPQERTIYMAAIEPKGDITLDKEPFPAEQLPPGGGLRIETA